MPVRAYQDGDRDRLLDVWYRASVIAHAFLDDAFFESERAAIAEDWLPSAETLVYVDSSSVDGHDEHLLGFLSLVGNEVGGFFVDPDHQGRGIGRALMDRARAARPFLELDVFERNDRGRRFYDAYGFHEVGRHLNEVVDQREIRLRLDPD